MLVSPVLVPQAGLSGGKAETQGQASNSGRRAVYHGTVCLFGAKTPPHIISLHLAEGRLQTEPLCSLKERGHSSVEPWWSLVSALGSCEVATSCPPPGDRSPVPTTSNASWQSLGKKLRFSLSVKRCAGMLVNIDHCPFKCWALW